MVGEGDFHLLGRGFAHGVIIAGGYVHTIFLFPFGEPAGIDSDIGRCLGLSADGRKRGITARLGHELSLLEICHVGITH